MSDPFSADISDADRALLRYAQKLTRTPHSIEACDIDNLRENGFSDEAIHDAAQVIALFNYYNRVADGLGLKSMTDPLSG